MQINREGLSQINAIATGARYGGTIFLLTAATGRTMLKIPLEQLAFIVEKAREFDAETAPVDADPGSHPDDDDDRAILEDTCDNPTRQELVAALEALDDEQRTEILALLWLGRGDFDVAEWHDAMVQAREIRNEHEIAYLIGTPLLADYLEEAISALGFSLEDYEKGRL
jgi:Protein of unknown function (DUF3775)